MQKMGICKNFKLGKMVLTFGKKKKKMGNWNKKTKTKMVLAPDRFIICIWNTHLLIPTPPWSC